MDAIEQNELQARASTIEAEAEDHVVEVTVSAAEQIFNTPAIRSEACEVLQAIHVRCGKGEITGITSLVCNQWCIKSPCFKAEAE